MRPLDESLMGCLVIDARTGVPLGRIRQVVMDPQDERIKALAAETALPNQGHPLVGQHLFDFKGLPLGTVVDVIAVLPEDPAGQGKIFLWLQPSKEPPEMPSAPSEELFEADDFMVGHVSLCCLLDKEGKPIVNPGETITLDIVRQAKKLGLLHRMECRFP